MSSDYFSHHIIINYVFTNVYSSSILLLIKSSFYTYLLYLNYYCTFLHVKINFNFNILFLYLYGNALPLLHMGKGYI